MKDASIVRWWAGFEGMISDKLPIIGEAANTPGFFHTCGFSTHGFQLAPIVGKLMAETLQGKTPRLSLEAFRSDRETLFHKDNDAPKKKGAWQ
jgi:glycine/D-amino acid oxidase-like deaminating enzyme